MNENRTEQGRLEELEARTRQYLAEADEPQPGTVDVKVENVSAATSTKKSGVEFNIATVLLGIVGGFFILVAMVLFGIHFMNGFAKGMCLYAGALAVLLVAELLLYRRWQRLGAVFTGLAIGGLYISTFINCLILDNFNMWIAMGVTLLIAIVVIVLGRKRTFFRTGSYILHMYVLGFYTFFLNCNAYETSGFELAGLFAVVGAFLILQILLVAQVWYQRKVSVSGGHVRTKGIAVAYFLNVILVLLSLSGDVIWNAVGIPSLMRHGFLACIAIMALVFMVILRRGTEMWYPYLCVNAAAYAVYGMSENNWENVICMAVLLGIAKLLSFKKISVLKGCDAVLTTWACILCLSFRQSPEGYMVVALLCVLLSIAFIRYWQTYFELIITFTLAFFAIAKLPTILQLETFVGILFVGILLFNSVKGWRGKHIRVYNYIVLAAQAICFLLLMNPVYRNAYIVYLCMLVFGLATIILTFQEKYGMDFKYRNLILAVFLTYMALVIKTEYPIINSILLMLIALVCVGLGFVTKEKTVRIYGLVLSLIICGKITLYDFFGAATIQKVILFLAVGMIALIIAAIYIVLEKNTEIKQSE